MTALFCILITIALFLWCRDKIIELQEQTKQLKKAVPAPALSFKNIKDLVTDKVAAMAIRDKLIMDFLKIRSELEKMSSEEEVDHELLSKIKTEVDGASMLLNSIDENSSPSYVENIFNNVFSTIAKMTYGRH